MSILNSSGPGISSFGLASIGGNLSRFLSTMGNSGAKLCTDIGVICSGGESRVKQ